MPQSALPNLMTPMRDGVLLASDLYRAHVDAGPVIVLRTPYDKSNPLKELDALLGAGYHVLIQDCRGRFQSQGSFGASHQEVDDGADCYAWVAAQPWCDGRIGTLGASYVAQVQWLAAPHMPDAVKALAVSVGPVDHYSDIAYRGGVLNLGSMLAWSSMMAIGERARMATQGRATAAEVDAQIAHMADMDALYRSLPLNRPTHLHGIAPHYDDWVAHPSFDDYWRAADARRFAQIDKPILHIGGWFDCFLNGTLQGFIGMRNHAPQAVRNRQRLIIGPWAHAQREGVYSELDYGPSASETAADVQGLQLRWLDRWVRDVQNGVEHEAPVRIFVMGINQWRDEQGWPLPDTRYTPCYLRSNGGANTRHGDGVLSFTPPADEPTGGSPSDRFDSDPRDPVPSIGGANLMGPDDPPGPSDQRSVEDRADVLVYSSDVLTRPLEITGPVLAHLFVSADAPDADIACKLVDVHPDGRALIIADGIHQLRYRESIEQPTLLAPGQIVPVTVDLWATSNVFLPGHRLRIEIAGSCFPRYARNSHSGGVIASEGADAYRVTQVRVYHDEERASRVVLPVIAY